MQQLKLFSSECCFSPKYRNISKQNQNKKEEEKPHIDRNLAIYDISVCADESLQYTSIWIYFSIEWTTTTKYVGYL